MRIAVSGLNNESVISKLESTLNVKAKEPWSASIIDCAAETYKYFNEPIVIFNGSVFDYLNTENAEGYSDVYEQIALSSLANLDYIIVVISNMDKYMVKLYEDYHKIFPEKFYIFNTVDDIEIVMK